MTSNPITEYTNQAITLKTKGVPNGANEAAYTTSTILGRLQYKKQMVRNAQGQWVQSEAQIFTASVINVDDLITVEGVDFPVITIEKLVDLDGIVLWYEVYL